MSAALLRRALRLLLLAVAAYYAVWGGEYSAFDLRQLARLQEQEAAALAATRAQVDSLRGHVERLDRDPATIERLARERFGMIRDGELLYRFVTVDSAAARRLRTAAVP